MMLIQYRIPITQKHTTAHASSLVAELSAVTMDALGQNVEYDFSFYQGDGRVKVTAICENGDVGLKVIHAMNFVRDFWKVHVPESARVW